MPSKFMQLLTRVMIVSGVIAWFVVPMFIVTVPTYAAEVTMAAPEGDSAVSIYGLTIIVEAGIIAFLLLVLVAVVRHSANSSIEVKDMIPIGAIGGLVETIKEVTAVTPTPLDDLVADVADQVYKKIIDYFSAPAAAMSQMPEIGDPNDFGEAIK